MNDHFARTLQAIEFQIEQLRDCASTLRAVQVQQQSLLEQAEQAAQITEDEEEHREQQEEHEQEEHAVTNGEAVVTRTRDATPNEPIQTRKPIATVHPVMAAPQTRKRRATKAEMAEREKAATAQFRREQAQRLAGLSIESPEHEAQQVSDKVEAAEEKKIDEDITPLKACAQLTNPFNVQALARACKLSIAAAGVMLDEWTARCWVRQPKSGFYEKTGSFPSYD